MIDLVEWAKTRWPDAEITASAAGIAVKHRGATVYVDRSRERYVASTGVEDASGATPDEAVTGLLSSLADAVSAAADWHASLLRMLPEAEPRRYELVERAACAALPVMEAWPTLVRFDDAANRLCVELKELATGKQKLDSAVLDAHVARERVSRVAASDGAWLTLCVQASNLGIPLDDTGLRRCTFAASASFWYDSVEIELVGATLAGVGYVNMRRMRRLQHVSVHVSWGEVSAVGYTLAEALSSLRTRARGRGAPALRARLGELRFDAGGEA